ncbi:hypothetical protein GCM10010124_02230 [Pilimelia terevasa]|uniref:Uncharacterized protein n=1 Tax=Pilimelia terevasa TaxID=53372 RepID=A0A8J3FDX5_9ACTN|nr:DUF5403 family protein [Pilimelia terevasa]GGK13220.1 hypothetical protein GCM10010124_02230 [Pilimelia terevasa]
MAKIYHSVGGRKTSKVLAENAGVQDALERITFEVAANADVALQEHRAEGHATIEVDHGKVDWYVVLSDERGQKAALSIEYGRAAHIDPKTGERKGAMEGLYILHRATHLPIRRGRQIKK